MKTSTRVRSLPSIYALLVLACSSSPPPAGGGGEPPTSNDLEDLECTGLPPMQIVSTDCKFSETGLEITARHKADSAGGDVLVQVRFASREPGVRETQYSGSMVMGEPGDVLPTDSVSLGAWCRRASSVYTVDPCTLELISIAAGNPDGATGSTQFDGSKVRMRVSCPDGINSQGGDDYGPVLHQISPQEFEFEATDCVSGQ